MQEPIHLILVSGIASLLVGGGACIYYFVYPKKSLPLFPLLLVISLLPILSIFRQGVYESSDFTIHTKFVMQFYENLSQGILIPQWIPHHCAGYGCPLFSFFIMTPYYLISFLHYLGFSFIMSMKLLLALSYIFSGIGMYLWIKNELNEKAGFVAAIFYLFAPYYLIDLHFRVSVGEVLSIALLPYNFYILKRFVESKKLTLFIVNAALFALLILSHPVTSFVTFPLLLLYGLYSSRKKKQNLLSLLSMAGSFCVGFLLSAFYVIPIFLERKYLQFNLDTTLAFNTFTNFFYSPGRFGLLFQGSKGELYFTVGYMHWIMLLLAFFLLVKHRVSKEKRLALAGLLILSVGLIFSMQEVTQPLWHHLPILTSFQFTWRLFIQLMLCIALLSGIVAYTIRSNKLVLIFCTLTILSSILNWGNRKMLPNITDVQLAKEDILHEFPGQVEITTPIFVNRNAPWIGKRPTHHIEVIKGTAVIKEISRSVVRHEYLIAASSHAVLKENTYYYPGWELFVNTNPTIINYKDTTFPGVIHFQLERGLYHVVLEYKDTVVRSLSKWISAITLIGVTLVVCLQQIRAISPFPKSPTKKGRQR